MSEHKTMTIAIDIGSTRTHAAVIDTHKLICFDRTDFDNDAFDEKFAPAIRALVGTHGNVRGINVSSCVKDLASKAADICASENLPRPVTIVSAQKNIRSNRHDTPPRSITINYDTPQTLGADRLCNALACAAMFNGENCVIIDAGTAITIDLLHNGVFEGGAILPGLSMQFNALHNGTDSLPSVKIHGGNATPPIGTSTADCIKIGVLYGAAGAVQRIVSEYLAAFGDARVVLTGGDRDVIAGLLDSDTMVSPNLTLIGAGIF